MNKRMVAATVAGLAMTGAFAAPAQAEEGKWWRVETTITMDHPRPVGSGYRLTERNRSVDWASPGGERWSAVRSLGARPRTAADEAAWKKDGSPATWTYRTEGMKITLSTKPGKGSLEKQEDSDSFVLGEKPITYRQLQQLPTDAAAMRAYMTGRVLSWIDEAAEEAKSTDPRATKQDWLKRQDAYVAEHLLQLLGANPVPQKVRAAAYEAFRTTKGVKDLGAAKDPLGRSGAKLALPDLVTDEQTLKEQVVVDTKTMTLLARYTGNTETLPGGKKSKGDRVETYKAGWTNDKPAIPDAR